MSNNANGSKITTQVVWLVAIVIIGLSALVLSLAVLAHWSDGAILAMFSGFATLATGLILAVRNQQRQAEVLDQLGKAIGAGQRNADTKLDTIKHQTNAISDDERSRLADEAATRAVMKVQGS